MPVQRIAEVRWQLPYLFIAALGFLPFIIPVHRYPLATFYPEWLAAIFALGLFVSVALLPARRVHWTVPAGAMAIAVFGLWAAARTWWEPPAFWQEPALYLLQLAAGIASMIAAATLARSAGVHRLVTILSIALLVGGIANAAAAVLQEFHLDQHISWLVFDTTVYGRPVGNVAQPNMLADYLGLALCGLLYLYLTGRVPLLPTVLLAAALLYGGEVARSRTWTVILAIVLVSTLAYGRFARLSSWRGRATRFAILLVAVWAALQLAIFLVQGGALSDSLLRFSNSKLGDFQRLSLWRAGFDLLAESPWTGVGLEQFDWAVFHRLPEALSIPIIGSPEHSHNLFVEVAVETGWPGLVLAVIAAALIFRALRWTRDPARLMATIAVTIIAAHSMFEYPLWYLHFIVVFAVLAGVLYSRRDPGRAPSRRQGPRLAVAAIGVAWAAVMAWTWVDYRELEWFLNKRPKDKVEEQRFFDLANQRLPLLARYSLFGPWAHRAMTLNIADDPLSIPRKAAICRKDLGFDPNALVSFKCAYILYLAGAVQEADHVFSRSARQYRAELPQIFSRLVMIEHQFPETQGVYRHFAALVPPTSGAAGGGAR